METILIGSGNTIHEQPATAWKAALEGIPAGCRARLAFMGDVHHRVRDFVVRELPREARPIPPARIAQALGLPINDVETTLVDLETHLFFLVRNAAGEVSWAFPVSADRTPHRLQFSTGERIHGAWAEDAFATSFVQGCLRKENMLVRIHSECACCRQPLLMEVDQDLHYRVLSEGAKPLLFEPRVDWSAFRGANIISHYWMESLFFWSEEHARRYQATHQRPPGAYLTLDQAAYAGRIAQAALFAFHRPR